MNADFLIMHQNVPYKICFIWKQTLSLVVNQKPKLKNSKKRQFFDDENWEIKF